MKLSTVSNYMKTFLKIVKIKNKNYHLCYKMKNPIGLVSNKQIMSLDGLNSPNSPRKIDHPNHTSLTKTIKLDDIF